MQYIVSMLYSKFVEFIPSIWLQFYIL
jgi:hypothetical protein